MDNLHLNSAGKLEGPDRTTISRGSYEYRSPEGHVANRVTEKADIFAIGWVALFIII